MNRENLIRMADYLENVVYSKGLPFGMSVFRVGDKTTHECNSMGDPIGHCTVLDEWDNIPKFPFGRIDFLAWAEPFIGITLVSDEWNWCFSSCWENTDNTALGAAKRIRYLLERGLPENWREQMFGEAELCYE